MFKRIKQHVARSFVYDGMYDEEVTRKLLDVKERKLSDRARSAAPPSEKWPRASGILEGSWEKNTSPSG